MSESPLWYVAGGGNQPAGPFTDKALIECVRTGKFSASTLCWREGMSQWLPLAQVEPFASAIASASACRPATPGAEESPAPRAGPAASPRAGVSSRRRSRGSPFWVGWAIAGGLAAVVGVVLVMKNRANNDSPGSEKVENWGSPIRVEHNDTTFLVGVKDAWFSDYGRSGFRPSSSGEKEAKKTFVVVYYYKNLGPREGSFSLHGGGLSNKAVEIKTDKGHLFSGREIQSGETPYLFKTAEERRDAVGWRPKQTIKIDETGESGLVFEIPTDEVPTELIATGQAPLNVTLPRRTFEFRKYTTAFGFLPSKGEKAVPGLIEALQVKNGPTRAAALEILADLGPAAKGAVPAIAKILLHDEYMDIRAAAAKALGEIGPAAKEAIPALRDPFRASRPQFGGVMENEVLEAARVARAKIGDDAEGLTNRGIKPPPKKPDIEDETKYKELIAKAQRAAEQRQWLKAHAGLEDARVRFARLFSEDAKASKLLEDAGVALALADAHKFLESASLDNAEMAVNKALSIRQTDKEAQGLLETIRNRQVDALVRDAETAGKAGDWEKAVECFQRAARILPSDAKIRAALEKAKSEVQSGRDKALVEQHRDKARKAIEDRNPSGAVEEILAARRILERSDAPWSAPLRETLEMLAKTLVEPLDGDIAKLAESRQYDDARKRVDNALRLQPDSQRLLELRKKIDTLADDPATASVSGTWVSPDGAECELVDHGTDIIGHKATKLPNYITACSGEWKRQGDKLTGRFRVVFARAPQQITEGTVVAKIKNANTLLLYWQDIIWIDRPKTGIWTWRGKGEALWTKPEGK